MCTGHSAGNLSLQITLKKIQHSHVMSQNEKRSLWQLGNHCKKQRPQKKKIVEDQLLSQCLHVEGTHYHGDDTIFLAVAELMCKNDKMLLLPLTYTSTTKV